MRYTYRAEVSYGEGVEREILQTAYQMCITPREKYMEPRAGGTFWTIATNALSHLMSPSFSEQLGVFGALTGLFIVNAIPPTPISPLFLNMMLNDSDIGSVSSSHLKEWLPEFAAQVQLWADQGLDADPSQFMGILAVYADVVQVNIIITSKAFHFSPSLPRLAPCNIGAPNTMRR